MTTWVGFSSLEGEWLKSIGRGDVLSLRGTSFIPLEIEHGILKPKIKGELTLASRITVIPVMNYGDPMF